MLPILLPVKYTFIVAAKTQDAVKNILNKESMAF